MPIRFSGTFLRSQKARAMPDGQQFAAVQRAVPGVGIGDHRA